MAEPKKYEFYEEKIPVVKESSSVVYTVANRPSVLHRSEAQRANLGRAITGEELLNRLRPRIKSLFE